ncbi:MAG TPA: cytochrome P450 [Acidimicrobiia bacterium]|nr:cytochrome P450 [Acidimicrobiia bacterium]
MTITAPVVFDPYSYDVHEDPYPTYRRLRDEAPAYLDAERGFWALSRDADVRSALGDPTTFSSRGGITLERRSEDLEPMLIELDPPRHTQLRSLVSRAFTPKRVADLETPIRELSRRLIAGFADRGTLDVITDFSATLPMAVISAMLGVPDDDQDELRAWSDSMLHREPDDDRITQAGIQGATELYAYFERLIARRGQDPGDDLVSALVAAAEGDMALTHSEILGFCFLLIIAGNETTTKLLGNAIHWLGAFPDERAKLLAQPGLIPAGVEEVLRFDTSTQGLARLLTRDVTMHGVTLPEGSKGMLLFASANRDDRRWRDPDVLDVDRNPAGHLAFGHGIHHCLGAALARLEARVALEELLPVLGEYEVQTTECERVHSGNVRGFTRLPVRFA